MNIDDVKKLVPIDQFVYWMKERHSIHLKRQKGLPAPWTDDWVLKTNFFTNPFRENDKTTVWFRKNVREPLKKEFSVVLATIIFRWFNLIETGEILKRPKSNAHTNFECRKDLTEVDKLNLSSLVRWDSTSIWSVLDAVRREGKKVFTGAFMINSPPGIQKLEAILERIDNVWKDRVYLEQFFRSKKIGDLTMEEVHKRLLKFPGLGGFMAYEVVTDLRYTVWLQGAKDKMTWCNPGPGASRGLHRVLSLEWESKGNNATAPRFPPGGMVELRQILHHVIKAWPQRDEEGKIQRPPIEMREIEHSLCEYDKYCRALYGDGRMKRIYDATGAKK